MDEGRKNTILVVDDEPEGLTLLRINLTARGFVVVTADSGNEALSAFDDNGIDLILLDLGLPDVEGLDVCREIRSRSQVPVVTMTAYPQSYARRAAMEAGASEFLEKPFAIPRLLTAINNALEGPACAH